MDASEELDAGKAHRQGIAQRVEGARRSAHEDHNEEGQFKAWREAQQDQRESQAKAAE